MKAIQYCVSTVRHLEKGRDLRETCQSANGGDLRTLEVNVLFTLCLYFSGFLQGECFCFQEEKCFSWFTLKKRNNFHTFKKREQCETEKKYFFPS